MRRLVLATLVVGAIAAANAGPAMADGLPKLSDVLSDPVGTVTETATTTVEDVTVAVDSTVQEVEGTVAEVVEGTGGTVETVTDNGANASQAGPAESAPPPAAETPAITSSHAALPAPADGGAVSEPSVAEPGAPGRLASASADVRDAGPVFRDVPSGSTPVVAGPERAQLGVASTPTPTSLSPEPIQAATADVVRNRTGYEPRPDRRAQADPPLPGGLALELPSSMPLVLALLGLLALTAPRPRGPRLRPAVATAHAADVRFRLVRPG